MIVFIVAMDSEAVPLREKFFNLREKVIHERKVLYGTLCGEDTAAVVCGVGKVNAAAGTQLAIDISGADIIVNIGVAGALNKSCKVGNIYCISHVVQYDFDLVSLNGTPMGTLNEYSEPYIPVNVTRTYPAKKLGTGDRFNDDKKDFELLTTELNADIRDMEFGAIAHVCAHAHTPCYSFKAISDTAGSGCTTVQYLENLSACINSLKADIEKIYNDVRLDN